MVSSGLPEERSDWTDPRNGNGKIILTIHPVLHGPYTVILRLLVVAHEGNGIAFVKTGLR